MVFTLAKEILLVCPPYRGQGTRRKCRVQGDWARRSEGVSSNSLVPKKGRKLGIDVENSATKLAAAISSQYGPANLGELILGAFEKSGKNASELTSADLSACSEFHIGGRPATLALAELAGIGKGTKVIDLGSGLGGPARTLAAELGAQVTALELSTPYHDAARLLAETVGIRGVTFVNGSALDIPAEEGSFDVVWMQHVQMNIEDKARLFTEIRRVIAPGGIFAWHGILRGSNSKPVLYPTTWADSAEMSFLVGAQELRNLAADAGLFVDETTWKDMSSAALELFASAKAKTATLPPEKRLGVNLLLGSSTKEKLPNLVKSIRDDRVAVHMAVFRAS